MIYSTQNAQICKNGSHYEADIWYFFIFKSLEESVAREKGKKGATVWIRAFIKLFSNALLHSQSPFGVCVSERVIYLTGQGHLHKASVRSTVHLQIEKKAEKQM